MAVYVGLMVISKWFCSGDLQPSLDQYHTSHSDLPHRLDTGSQGCLLVGVSFKPQGVFVLPTNRVSFEIVMNLLWVPSIFSSGPVDFGRHDLWCTRKDLMKGTDDELHRVSSVGVRGTSLSRSYV